MDGPVSSSDQNSLDQAYQNLINLWTDAVRDYNSLLSDYLTANSIFVAAIGFLFTRQPSTLICVVLILILCSFGVLMAA